jgi:hypothetical protein
MDESNGARNADPHTSHESAEESQELRKHLDEKILIIALYA